MFRWADEITIRNGTTYITLNESADGAVDYEEFDYKADFGHPFFQVNFF